jgi:hypothetical protein
MPNHIKNKLEIIGTSEHPKRMILIPVLRFLFLCWNRFWRHLNINKHGYPPAHCDADGDFVKEENKSK